MSDMKTIKAELIEKFGNARIWTTRWLKFPDDFEERELTFKEAHDLAKANDGIVTLDFARFVNGEEEFTQMEFEAASSYD